MNKKLQFYFDKMEVTVQPDSFLIQIAPVANPPRQDDIKDFPLWTFRSKNAIWFCDEDQSYGHRANHGDQIKQQLLQLLKAHQNRTSAAAVCSD